MNLYSVIIRCDCTRQTAPPIMFSDHEIILDANTRVEAERLAMEWLEQHNPCTTPVHQSQMQVLNVVEIESIRVYNDARIAATVDYREKRRPGRI